MIKASITLILLILFAFSITAKNKKAPQKPNVIVIVADDVGYADVGFHKHVAPGVCTPNLDKLAQKGVVFTQAYASSPVCSNSRLGLSTGRYAQRWGAYYYGQGGMPTTEYAIAEMMREAGYRTMKVGKTHLNKGPKSDPMKHGFDHWLGFKNHSWDFFLLSQKDVDAYEKKSPGCVATAKHCPLGPLTRDSKTKESFENTSTTEVFTKESIKFIKEKDDKPFYLQLEYNAVHTPLTRAPKAVREKYGIPERKFNREDEVWEYPIWDPIKEPVYLDWYDKTCHLKKVDPYGRKIYLAHLEYMDMMIGELVKTLKKKGVYDNTLIFFTSDNGGSHQSYANNQPINAYKYCLMDGGIRVPMFIHWPAGFKHKKVDALVTHRDLYASLSEITGVAPKNSLDGKSLLPIINGKTKELHTEPLFWDSGMKQQNWVVRWGDYKLVYRKGAYNYQAYELDENGLVKDALIDVPIPAGMQLYNMVNDPNETTNLASSMPQKVAEMKKLHEDWRAQMAEPIRGIDAK